jgi:hypothetical protein
MKEKLLLFTFLLFQLGFSQIRTCGLENKMNELMFNPIMKQKYEERQQKFNIELNRLQSNNVANRSSSTLNNVRIPVAIHYPEAGAANATLRNCLKALAQNQIDILNADYNALNSDLSIWNSTTGANYPGVNVGSLAINLELATQNHPAISGITNGEVAVTFGYDYGNGSDWDANWAGYLNLVVKDLGGGLLGYAYLASSPSDGAAIFINKSAFGSGVGCTGYIPGAPYNKGRTLTHELGHYFNLEHIWGDANCGNDFVADTPQHNTANGGCPLLTHTSTCTGNPLELTMNYMDYTYDACMYMFTAGQALRQQAHFNTIVSDFNQNTLSNSDFDKKNSFSIYPNPNKGDFTLLFSEYLPNFSVDVIDQSGRLVYQKKYDNQFDLEQRISLDNLASGIYFVKVTSNNGALVKKIIIE